MTAVEVMMDPPAPETQHDVVCKGGQTEPILVHPRDLDPRRTNE